MLNDYVCCEFFYITHCTASSMPLGKEKVMRESR